MGRSPGPADRRGNPAGQFQLEGFGATLLAMTVKSGPNFLFGTELEDSRNPPLLRGLFVCTMPDATEPVNDLPEATPPPEAIQPDLAAQLAAAKQEAAVSLDLRLRAAADLENFRRRTVREKDELRQFAASRVLEDLLPVLDNLALGLAATRPIPRIDWSAPCSRARRRG